MFQERQDEVVYYDTFESADDITEDDSAEREELQRLQASARQLEVRRGRITAKRSYLRNKRVSATVTVRARVVASAASQNMNADLAAVLDVLKCTQLQI